MCQQFKYVFVKKSNKKSESQFSFDSLMWVNFLVWISLTCSRGGWMINGLFIGSTGSAQMNSPLGKNYVTLSLCDAV